MTDRESVVAVLANAMLTYPLFERKFFLEFVEIYKSHPALWKVKSKEYYDKNKKNAGYDLLVQKMKERNPAANRDTVTKKINNIRSTFRKEWRKVEESVRSGAEEIYKPSLWYFEALLFLKDEDLAKPSPPILDEVTMIGIVTVHHH